MPKNVQPRRPWNTLFLDAHEKKGKQQKSSQPPFETNSCSRFSVVNCANDNYVDELRQSQVESESWKLWFVALIWTYSPFLSHARKPHRELFTTLWELINVVSLPFVQTINLMRNDDGCVKRVGMKTNEWISRNEKNWKWPTKWSWWCAKNPKKSFENQ